MNDSTPQFIPITNKRMKDLTGKQFGRLLVLGFVARDARQHPLWLCRCECGKNITTLAASLTGGRTQSCGCLQKERAARGKTTHGLSRTVEYNLWNGIKARCENPNEIGYDNYGGRGIKMCERWRHSFENFLTDVGRRPGPEYSLDRIDNNGDYEPENTRWATRKEQTNNTRRNHLLEYNGEKLTISQWSDRTGISRMLLRYRIMANWSAEKALTTPSDRNSLEFQGERLTFSQWAKKMNIPVRTLRYRIKIGWSVEQVLTTPSRQR